MQSTDSWSTSSPDPSTSSDTSWSIDPSDLVGSTRVPATQEIAHHRSSSASAPFPPSSPPPSPCDESGRVADILYLSPPTSPETPTRQQMDTHRQQHRFQSSGRPLSEPSAKRGWWFWKDDADNFTVRPRVRAFERLLGRRGPGVPFIRRSRGWLSRDESSTMAEKRRDRNRPTVPVYTRWRYTRAYKWVVLLLVVVLFFGHATLRLIGRSLPRDAAYIPAGYVDPSAQFHFTQRRLAGSPRDSVGVEERGLKQRLKKSVKDRISGDKEPGRHQIHNGLLSVDMSLPLSAHPITQLIKDAKDTWDAKNARQSKTLKQAVAEYKRRNPGMNPPKGFDKWWKFVVENDVPLVDEYDAIMRDISIFHAFSPSQLDKVLDATMQLPDTFTISIHKGNIRTRANYADGPIGGAPERISGQVDMLRDFGISDWIPDCRAVFSFHDTPQSFIAFEHRSDLQMHAVDREYYDPDGEELDTSLKGWAAACPQTSNMKQRDTSKGAGKAFVADIKAQSDLCQHPYNIPLHGFTAGKEIHVDGLVKPIFSLSKTSLHADILAVPVEQWLDNLPVVPWANRTMDKLLWRGSNTGMYYHKDTPWQNSHRIRAINLTRPDAAGSISLLPPASSKTKQQLGEAVSVQSLADVNKRMFDVTFAGSPIQCEVEDGTCQELEELFDFKKSLVTHEEALNYKYILDIDGNSWSARFSRLLAGGNLVFKSTIMPEWWNDRIQPWIHYIPIQLDYSDLHDALTFFRGDENGENGNDGLASEIAASGLIWFKTHWRRVDMAAYTARLYLEWARLLAPNRQSMDFVYSPEMEIPPGNARPHP